VVGVKLNVATHLITSAPVRLIKMRHHLIRNSLQGSGEALLNPVIIEGST
jgi:hypothetical protein